MGGLIASGFVLRRAARIPAVSSLLLSAPAWAVPGIANKILFALAPMLAAVLPTLDLSNGLKPQQVSRVDAVVKAYASDPLVHDRITPSWVAAFAREQRFVAQHIDQLQLPTLLLVAEADSLTDPQWAQKLFQQIASATKQMVLYPHAYHEIFNEPESREALAVCSAFIQQ